MKAWFVEPKVASLQLRDVVFFRTLAVTVQPFRRIVRRGGRDRFKVVLQPRSCRVGRKRVLTYGFIEERLQFQAPCYDLIDSSP